MDPGSEQRELPGGTMLDEKYRVDSLLAVGGMGAVYVGTHTKLRKRVAIKVLNPELSNPQMIERFHREAITASQIGHEGIAQVTDIGTSAQGEPFLVMELLEGESLGKRLRSTGPLPIHEACELTCAILAPLGAAHRAGIVHRDLKPDNVFLVQQSRGEMVKLLDFGISRATAAADPTEPTDPTDPSDAKDGKGGKGRRPRPDRDPDKPQRPVRPDRIDSDSPYK
jgi:eukaryotic-like serine/threonine-protein kinase